MNARQTLVLDRALTNRLDAAAGRWRRCVLIEGVAWIVGVLVCCAVVQFLLDYGTHGLRWSMRAALLAVAVGFAGWTSWRRLLNPLRKKCGHAEVANLVERKYPQLSSGLISAIRFARGEVGDSASNSPELVASVVRQASVSSASLDFDAVVNADRAKRSTVVLGAAVLFCAIVTLSMPDLAGLWFSRNVLLSNVEWPRRTTLVVDLENGEIVGARGDDLVVEAHAQGVEPRLVEIIFETESGTQGRETMVTVGGKGAYRYRYTFKGAKEDFSFRLEGGDDVTETYRARLLERPRVTESVVRITPPEYTNLTPFTLEQGKRAAQVLPGSEVSIAIQTNHPVVEANLMASRDLIAPAQNDEGGYAAVFHPAKTETYHFSLRDEQGLENRQPVRFSLRVIKDEAPRVKLKLAGVGDMITPQAVLPIEVEFADTYGLATVELVIQVSREGSIEQTIEFAEFHAGSTSFSTSLLWAVKERGLMAGERLTMFARAGDFDTVSGPKVAQSPEVTLRVVTRDELLAELARREQEFRMDFERLTDAQEQQRGRLLSLLGRHGGGEDVEELASSLGPLERRQRNLTSSVNVVRQQFEQILTEMRINGLTTVETEERIGEGVVEPLTELVRRMLPEAADTIRRWSRAGSPEEASGVDPAQAAALSRMRAVLANMLQWEGYQEVVNLLRDIIRLQTDLNQETRTVHEDQAGSVFDD